MRISDWSSDVCSSDLHHRFEKPGGMREMPFGRARIGHRLHRGIGIRQRFGKFQARVANVSVMSAKVFGFGDETARGGSIHATPLYWLTDVPQPRAAVRHRSLPGRSEEHTSDLQSLMRTSYAV